YTFLTSLAECSGDHTELHSFPTRRSSDLESLHSTAGYAKFKNPTVQKEYKKLGFNGMIVEEISEDGLDKADLSEEKLKKAALPEDRKSTRLNSSHVSISYAVFCLKKKRRK